MLEGSLAKVYRHPERDSILEKLAAGIEPKDINADLRERYLPLGEKRLVLSVNTLTEFKEQNLNVYQEMQKDLAKIRSNELSPEEMKLEIQGTSAYKDLLERHASIELDVKNIIKNLALVLEDRVEQMYNLMSAGKAPKNAEYVIVQLTTTLISAAEKYHIIANGLHEQNITNNTINVQIVESRISVVIEAIRATISKMDYETSLFFISELNKNMQLLKTPIDEFLPSDLRISEVKALEKTINTKLEDF